MKITYKFLVKNQFSFHKYTITMLNQKLLRYKEYAGIGEKTFYIKSVY